MMQRVGEARRRRGSGGVPADLELIAADGRGQSRRCRSTQTVSRTAAAPPRHGHAGDVDERVPAERARRRGPRGASRRRVTVRGASRREERALTGAPARAAPSRRRTRKTPTTSERERGEAGPAAAVGRRGRDGDHRGWVAAASPPSERIARRRPGARATARGERRDADDEPRPPRPRPGRVRAGRPTPGARPRTPPAASGAPQPRIAAHTVTWDRRSSSVAGPIPETSSS